MRASDLGTDKRHAGLCVGGTRSTLAGPGAPGPVAPVRITGKLWLAHATRPALGRRVAQAVLEDGEVG